MMIQGNQKSTPYSDSFIQQYDFLKDQHNCDDMPVKFIMRKDVEIMDHAYTAYDAAILMMKKGVGCVIVTAYGKLFGMITERDIICSVVGLNMPLRNLVLSFLASRPLICVKPHQTVEDAVDLMRKYNIRHLPVVDKGRIVGLLNITDLIMFSSVPKIRFCKNYSSNDMAMQKIMIRKLIELD